MLFPFKASEYKLTTYSGCYNAAHILGWLFCAVLQQLPGLHAAGTLYLLLPVAHVVYLRGSGLEWTSVPFYPAKLGQVWVKENRGKL